ncbi:unnamed protein product [Leptidea sinapis]|uniref:Uncharacterized protein n=1 Tax=Leptidea sinapis TaxID=189913 RepID=A0A5E4Q622_9NEOP|nr:unnamed protein product [Leptidea sinapis]
MDAEEAFSNSKISFIVAIDVASRDSEEEETSQNNLIEAICELIRNKTRVAINPSDINNMYRIWKRSADENKSRPVYILSEPMEERAHYEE